MSTRAFIIDFGEDRNSLRICLLHKERWRERDWGGRLSIIFYLNSLHL